MVKGRSEIKIYNASVVVTRGPVFEMHIKGSFDKNDLRKVVRTNKVLGFVQETPTQPGHFITHSQLSTRYIIASVDTRSYDALDTALITEWPYFTGGPHYCLLIARNCLFGLIFCDGGDTFCSTDYYGVWASETAQTKRKRSVIEDAPAEPGAPGADMAAVYQRALAAAHTADILTELTGAVRPLCAALWPVLAADPADAEQKKLRDSADTLVTSGPRAGFFRREQDGDWHTCRWHQWRGGSHDVPVAQVQELAAAVCGIAQRITGAEPTAAELTGLESAQKLAACVDMLQRLPARPADNEDDRAALSKLRGVVDNPPTLSRPKTIHSIITPETITFPHELALQLAALVVAKLTPSPQ
jgi:hypothetical protein